MVQPRATVDTVAISSTGATFFGKRRFPNAMKHAIVGAYVPEALRVLMLYAKKDVVYADLFAGEGRYGDGSPGSPLIVAERAADRFKRNLSPLIRCFNVEADPKRYDRLVENTKHIPGAVITNRKGAWDAFLPELLELITGRPAILFLDPFGFRAIELSRMTQILAGIGAEARELIITFNLPRLQRIVSAAYAAERRGHKHHYYELPNAVFGTDEWRGHIDNGVITAEGRENLLALYRRQLLRTGGDPFTRRVVVSTDIPERLDGPPAYYLIFVTRSEKAMTMIGEAVNKADERARLEAEEIAARESTQLTLDLPELGLRTPTVTEREAAMLPRLRDAVIAQFRSAPGPLAFEDLYVQVARVMLGEFREKHLRRVVKTSRAEGILETSTTAIERQTIVQLARGAVGNTA